MMTYKEFEKRFGPGGPMQVALVEVPFENDVLSASAALSAFECGFAAGDHQIAVQKLTVEVAEIRDNIVIVRCTLGLWDSTQNDPTRGSIKGFVLAEIAG